jgi:hypothetical protein
VASRTRYPDGLGESAALLTQSGEVWLWEHSTNAYDLTPALIVAGLPLLCAAIAISDAQFRRSSA